MDNDVNNVSLQPEEDAKRKRRPETWKANVEKRKRHASSLPPIKPACGHNNDSTYKCGELTTRDINNFHKTFHSEPVKTVQDCFILKYTSSMLPARSGTRKCIASTESRKSCSIKYFIKKAVLAPKTKPMIRVCSSTFLNVLRISKDRVQRICKNNLMTGSLPTEKRGGDRDSSKFVTVEESM